MAHLVTPPKVQDAYTDALRVAGEITTTTKHLH